MQLVADHAIIEHDQLLENGLVHQPPDVRRRQVVGGLDVGRQLKRRIEVAERHVVLAGQSLHGVLGRCPLTADALLFLTEKLLGNMVGVVRLKQLALLFLEPGQLALGAHQLLGTQGCQRLKALSDGPPQRVPPLGLELDGRVVTDHRLLDGLEAAVTLRAFAELLGTAEEVVVGATVATVPREDQPPATLRAVQAAFQVAGVNAVAVAGILLFL